MRRETGGKGEHRLRVYSELIFGHEADKPANGTKNYNRTCMAYPFKGEMTVDESATDFRIAIDGFKKTARLTTGALPMQASISFRVYLHARGAAEGRD